MNGSILIRVPQWRSGVGVEVKVDLEAIRPQRGKHITRLDTLDTSLHS